MKTPDNFLDSVLKLPRKVDFIHYCPFAGGDFFTSLIILSHEKSKKLIVNFTQQHPKFLNNKQIDKNGFIVKINSGYTIFSKPQYNNMTYLKPASRIVQYMEIDDIINLYKYSLINAFLPSYPNPPEPQQSGLLRYKDSIILICDHWIMNPNKMKIFSKSEYWGMISLDPETKYSKKLMVEMNKKVGSVTQKHQEIFMDRFPFLERFPFLDYILEKDYNTIKYWIENRYGSDLDFDFIDRSLKMWREVRVDPYL
jgi:hypothetical protein